MTCIFITTNNGVGPQAYERIFNYNCAQNSINWENGDIVQIKYASYAYPRFGHSTIITGQYYVPMGSYDYSYSPRITYRSSDYSYGINEPLIVKYPLSDPQILAYRLIHLTRIGY